ncbi:hypothetical protein AXX17_AT3G35190 [Arabidopsis thaliana]|uniref:Uncharacterized protein n=1 Tax=Arabidopsis thaliana TaxID=3702 RepID=A0A178VHX5_ARATH|nr:hypothetical protein AXX17_AT3G35190 [Arabidopsis thaliana]
MIFKSDFRFTNPINLYNLLKSNVNALSLIQLYLILSGVHISLPYLGCCGGDR